MDILERLTEEQVKYLEGKYGHFWRDSLEVYELLGESPPVITTFTENYTKVELEEEIQFILSQLTNNQVFHIHLLKRLERILSILQISEEKVIEKAKEMNIQPPMFCCDASWKEDIFHIEMNHQLPKMKKVVEIKEYQILRDYYVPRMMESFVKEKPNIPLERCLIFIEHYVGDHRLFDYDNRFRSFVLDALERSKIIKNDSGDNIMLLEKMHRMKDVEKTYVRVIPQHKIQHKISDFL